MTDPDPRLKARVAGRDAAKAVLQLASEEAMRVSRSNEALDRSIDSWKAFWEEIRDDALEHVPLPAPEIKVLKARPMTDAECREFEKESVPLGVCKSFSVGSVMAMRAALQLGDRNVSGTEHLRWLADQTFIDDLRRYLANETVARSES